MTKTEIFRAAHAAAKTALGPYRARFAAALRAAYAALKAPPPAPIVVKTTSKLDALACIVIQWPRHLRGRFAFRFVTDNADRLIRYGDATKFSAKQVAIIDDMYAKYC